MPGGSGFVSGTVKVIDGPHADDEPGDIQVKNCIGEFDVMPLKVCSCVFLFARSIIFNGTSMSCITVLC